MSESDTRAPYRGKRRREGEPDHSNNMMRRIQKWGAIAAALPAIGAAIFTITNLWFQSDAEASEARAAIAEEQRALTVQLEKEAVRNDKQDELLNAINGKLDRGEILALKAERRGLRMEIDSAGKNTAIRRRLEMQLESVDEDLRVKGIQ